MFFFGAPEDTAKFYMDSLENFGPEIPDCHYTEMGLDDLRNFFAMVYGVTRQAARDGVPDEVLEILLESYDELFEYIASVDSLLPLAVAEGKHQFITGREPWSVEKYKKLAGILA